MFGRHFNVENDIDAESMPNENEHGSSKEALAFSLREPVTA
jgi:hypothetical protein